MIKIGGGQYMCTRGSDVDRDGMYLELQDEKSEAVLEIFYSDQTGAMTFTAFSADIPVEIVEWALEQAKKDLPPKG